MVSKLRTKGLIKPTQKRARAETLRKKKASEGVECLWVTGRVNSYTNNSILEDL